MTSVTSTTRDDRAARTARRLTAITAALVAGASAAGLWLPELYTDGVAVRAVLRGYDVVTLAVIAPLLVATLRPTWRDRPAASLTRIGLLAFCTYNYAYYLFGAAPNAALLAHIGIVVATVAALVLSLVALDVVELGRAFRPGTRVRTVATLLLLLALPLAAIQITTLLGAAASGLPPTEPSQLVVTPAITRLGAVLDLTVLVPTYVLAAVWLWRRVPSGYLAATAVLLAGALHQVSYISGMAFQLAADVPGAAFDPFEPVILGVYLAGSGLLLAGLARRPGERADRAGRVRVLAGR